MIPVNPFDSTGAGQSLTSTPISLSPLNMGCLSADPDVAFSNIGDFYLNTTNNILRIFDGTLWNDWGIYGGSAQLTASNTFTRGPQAIQTGSDGNPGFNIFRNSASQSGALLTLFHSNFISVLARFDANGNLTLRNDNGIAAGIPLSITANATQSSNLFQILASDNSTVRAAIGSAGTLTISPSSGTAATINAATSATLANIGLVINSNTGGGGGNAIQIYNTSSALISHVGSDGTFGVRSSGSGYGASLSVGAGSSGTIGVTVRGVVSQSADLQQWQNSAGTVLASVSSGGNIFIQSTSANFAVGTNLGVKASSSSSVPFSVAAAGSQSVDLTRWYASDGTTVLAKIAASGVLTVSPTTGASAGAATTINAASSATLANIGLSVYGNSGGGTGDIARFYHTNGSTYSGFDSASRLFVRTSGVTLGTPSLGVSTGSDTTIGLVIRGDSATQSADLTQWQTSAAAVGTRVVAGGGIIAVEPIVTSTAGAGTTTTLDCSTGTTFTVTFGAGNITGLLFTNLPSAGSVTITLILKQDSVGSRTITWSGTQVNGSSTNATPKWAGGTAPTLTTTANAVDMITLVINRTSGATDNVYGFLAGKAFA